MGKLAVSSLVVLSLAGTAAALLRVPAPIDARAASAIYRDPGCKPQAPIEFKLIASRVQAGVLSFDYEVKPTLAADALETEIDPSSDGGTVLSGAKVAALDVKRGETFVGSGRVRLPSHRAGGRVILHAHLRFPGEAITASGATTPTGVETNTADFAIEWGDATPHVDNVTLVDSAGTPSLDCPATRQGASR